MKKCSFYLLLIATFAKAQVQEPKSLSPDWAKLYEPFHVVGNVYYVGTYDLACYLITSKQGHVLINTGLAASAPIIEQNVKALGFNFQDIKILLTTQAHWDHNGAMAAIKAKTGAKLMVNEKDVKAMEDGGFSDYAFGGTITFVPVKVDQVLKPNDMITLGEIQIKMLNHAGHSKGSSSYFLTVKDEKKSYQVLIANMPTVVVDQRLSEVTAYPTIVEDLTNTFQSMKSLQFDIWLASHASQFKLHSKRKAGDAYNPEVFIDRTGYDKLLASLEDIFNKKK